MYRADGKRLVLLPPKGDGAAVLLETSEPERFVREVRQAWPAAREGRQTKAPAHSDDIVPYTR
jgi:hypothetical protein